MITRTELHNVKRITQKLEQFGTFSVIRISAYVDEQSMPATFDLFVSDRNGLTVEVLESEVITN